MRNKKIKMTIGIIVMVTVLIIFGTINLWTGKTQTAVTTSEYANTNIQTTDSTDAFKVKDFGPNLQHKIIPNNLFGVNSVKADSPEELKEELSKEMKANPWLLISIARVAGASRVEFDSHRSIADKYLNERGKDLYHYTDNELKVAKVERVKTPENGVRTLGVKDGEFVQDVVGKSYCGEEVWKLSFKNGESMYILDPCGNPAWDLESTPKEYINIPKVELDQPTPPTPTPQPKPTPGKPTPPPGTTPPPTFTEDGKNPSYDPHNQDRAEIGGGVQSEWTHSEVTATPSFSETATYKDSHGTTTVHSDGSMTLPDGGTRPPLISSWQQQEAIATPAPVAPSFDSNIETEYKDPNEIPMED